MIRLMHSFPGYVVPQPFLDAVRDGRAGSFCLFAYNVESVSQLKALTDSLYAAAAEGNQPPPLIGIDQEGGQLQAIDAGATAMPGNMALGATRSADLAYRAGVVLGRELLALGVNLNFAPSLDVNSNPANPVIGIRAFADDPSLVAELGRAQIAGMQSVGVIATAKHFPGHGDVTADTHHAAPVVTRDRDTLEQIEIRPFRRAVEGGVGAIMSSHVIYQALDPAQPATLSRAIMTDLLRGDLGYEGLSITDAMDMSAVSRFGRQSILDALAAGTDLILLGHLPDQLELAASLQGIPIGESSSRIQAARLRIPLDCPPMDVLDSADHRAVARAIAEAAVTVVKGHSRLPLARSSEEPVLVITPEPANLTPADTSSRVAIGLGAAIGRHTRVHEAQLPHRATDADVKRLAALAGQYSRVIIGTIAADRDPYQAELVRQIHAQGSLSAVIAMRTPYDICAFPQIDTYLCAYGIREPNLEAAARVLFGEITAVGTLPCRLPCPI